MVAKKLLPLILLCFSHLTLARTLMPGEYVFIEDIYLTKSKSLWANSSDEINITDEQQFLAFSSNFLMGLPNLMQLDLKLTYSKSKMKGGPFEDAPKGSGQSRLNEMAIQLSKLLYDSDSYGIDLFLGYTHPGKDQVTIPVFVSLNDFTHKITFGVKNIFYFKHFNLDTNLRYVFRTDAPKDQLAFDIVAPIKVFEGMRFGPGLNWTHTFGGMDIGSTEWTNYKNSTGITPFHLKQEKFIGATLFFEKDIGNSMWSGLSYNKKLWGRNTNKGYTLTATFGIAI